MFFIREFMKESSYLDFTNAEYIENLHQSFLNDPTSVDAYWQKFFEGLEFAVKNYSEEVEGLINPPNDQSNQTHKVDIQKIIKVLNLINAYRSRGHLIAVNNPIRSRSDHKTQLGLADFGLSKADLDDEFELNGELGFQKAKLSEIISKLKRTYCGSTGVEYMHMRQPEALKWMQEKVEKNDNAPQFIIKS